VFTQNNINIKRKTKERKQKQKQNPYNILQFLRLFVFDFEADKP
jgi:hypothetical protein